MHELIYDLDETVSSLFNHYWMFLAKSNNKDPSFKMDASELLLIFIINFVLKN